MLLPNTLVTILDTKNNTMHNLCVNEIIPRFHLDARFTDDYDENGFLKILSVDIKPDDKLMIKDLDGWTSLLSITELKIPYNRKYFIVNDEIIVSEYELLPVYSPENYRDGFHGAILYRHELTKVTNIEDRVILRKHMNEFQSVSVDEVYSDVRNGYRIKTESGFCNVGKYDGYRFRGGIDQKIGYH